LAEGGIVEEEGGCDEGGWECWDVMGFLGEGTWCRLSSAAAVGAEAAMTSKCFDGDGVMTTTWPVSSETGGLDDAGMCC